MVRHCKKVLKLNLKESNKTVKLLVKITLRI